MGCLLTILCAPLMLVKSKRYQTQLRALERARERERIGLEEEVGW